LLWKSANGPPHSSWETIDILSNFTSTKIFNTSRSWKILIFKLSRKETIFPSSFAPHTYSTKYVADNINFFFDVVFRLAVLASRIRIDKRRNAAVESWSVAVDARLAGQQPTYQYITTVELVGCAQQTCNGLTVNRISWTVPTPRQKHSYTVPVTKR